MELTHLDVSAHGAFKVQGDVGKRRPTKAPATFRIPAFQNPKVIEAGVALKGLLNTRKRQRRAAPRANAGST